MKYLYTLACALLVSATLLGCEALVDGYEDDPNAEVDAPADLRLQYAQVAYIVFQEGETARAAGIFADYFTGSERQYDSYDIYEVSADAWDGMWNNAYVRTLAQLQLVKELAGENNPYVRGIARVLEGNVLGDAAALWGDIPLDQIADFDNFPNPEYRDQLLVYRSVQDSLDLAIADLTAFVAEDASELFVGDVFALNAECYIQVANTLKARYYTHVGDYDNAITAATNGINATACDLVAPHAGGTLNGDANMYYQFVQARGGYITGFSARSAQLLADRGETARYQFYYTGPVASAQLNIEAGAYASTADFPIITFVENQLILAESYARTGNDAQAQIELDAAKAAIELRFGEAPPAADPANLLNEIIIEKYLALIGTIEGFTVARQYNNWQNVLGITPSPGAAQAMIPMRFSYSEQALNANANAPEPLGVFAPTPALECIDDPEGCQEPAPLAP